MARFIRKRMEVALSAPTCRLRSTTSGKVVLVKVECRCASRGKLAAMDVNVKWRDSKQDKPVARLENIVHLGNHDYVHICGLMGRWRDGNMANLLNCSTEDTNFQTGRPWVITYRSRCIYKEIAYTRKYLRSDPEVYFWLKWWYAKLHVRKWVTSNFWNSFGVATLSPVSSRVVRYRKLSPCAVGYKYIIYLQLPWSESCLSCADIGGTYM